jgi:hypothetical protein
MKMHCRTCITLSVSERTRPQRTRKCGAVVPRATGSPPKERTRKKREVSWREGLADPAHLNPGPTTPVFSTAGTHAPSNSSLGMFHTTTPSTASHANSLEPGPTKPYPTPISLRCSVRPVHARNRATQSPADTGPRPIVRDHLSATQTLPPPVPAQPVLAAP